MFDILVIKAKHKWLFIGVSPRGNMTIKINYDDVHHDSEGRSVMMRSVEAGQELVEKFRAEGLSLDER